MGQGSTRHTIPWKGTTVTDTFTSGVTFAPPTHDDALAQLRLKLVEGIELLRSTRVFRFDPNHAPLLEVEIGDAMLRLHPRTATYTWNEYKSELVIASTLRINGVVIETAVQVTFEEDLLGGSPQWIEELFRFNVQLNG